MPELDPVRARLSADISDLVSKLQEAKRGFVDLGESGHKSGSDLSEAMSEAGHKMAEMVVEAFAVKEMFELVGESMHALGEKQDAINGLNLALAAQGHYSQEASEELRKYADELERTTTFDDSAIIGAEKYFAVLGMNNDQIERATKAATNWATVSGKDMVAAAHDIGKAVETGSARAMGIYGVEVDKSADATTRLKEVLDGIESKMGGQATAAASTYTGQMKQLGVATEDTQAAFGFFLTQLATPPSGEMVGFVRGLGDFFSHDLVMGIAYVRAGISLIPASILDMVSSADTILSQHPTLVRVLTGDIFNVSGKANFAGHAQQTKDMADSLRYGADQIIADAQKAIATGIQGTVTPTNNPNPSGFHAADEGKRIEDATKAITDSIQKMDAAGEKAYGTIAKNAAYAAAMQEGLGATYAEFAAKQDEVDSRTDQALTALQNEYNAAMEAAQKAGASTDALTESYQKNQQAIIDAGNSQHAMNDAQRDASLGTITQSDAVKTLAADHSELSASLKKVAEDEKIAAEQSIAMREGIIGIAGAASGLASALGMGGLSSALSAVQTGMSDFNKMANAQNPLQLAIAGIGFATDIVKGIKSLFGGKTEAERIGEDLGDGVTDGVVKAIEATEKKNNVSRAIAEMMHASDVLKDEGLNDTTQKLISDEMNAIKLGAIDAKSGIEDLGKAFTQLQQEAEGGNVASEAAMVQMIQRSRELGESIPALDKYVTQLMTDASKQLQALYSGQMPGAGGSGQASANNQLFDAVFQGSILKNGLIAAMQEMAPSLDALKKANPGGVLSGTAAEADSLSALMRDPAFKGAAGGADAAGKLTKDLLDSGNLSQKSLDSLETTSRTFYDQALEAATKQLGAQDAQRAAEEAMLPELVQMAHAQAMGLRLSPDMQAMLSQAQHDGLLPALDINVQQLGMQQQIRDGVYKLAGLQVPQNPNGGDNPPGSPGSPGSPGGPSGGDNPTNPSEVPPPPPPPDLLNNPDGYAVGTPYVPQDMFTKIHKGEAVIPARLNPFAGGNGGASGGGGMHPDVVLREFSAIRNELARMPQAFAANIRDALQVAGLTR